MNLRCASAILVANKLSTILDNYSVTSCPLSMQATEPISKIVSSTEAKARFGALLKWASRTKDRVIVKLYGEPTGVIMSYDEYAEVEQLRKREQKRQALAALDALRNEARLRYPELTAEEAYRAAGFSDEVIQETLQADQEFDPREV